MCNWSPCTYLWTWARVARSSALKRYSCMENLVYLLLRSENNHTDYYLWYLPMNMSQGCHLWTWARVAKSSALNIYSVETHVWEILSTCFLVWETMWRTIISGWGWPVQYEYARVFLVPCKKWFVQWVLLYIVQCTQDKYVTLCKLLEKHGHV